MDKPKCHFNTFCNFENWEKSFWQHCKTIRDVVTILKTFSIQEKAVLIEKPLYNKVAVSS